MRQSFMRQSFAATIVASAVMLSACSGPSGTSGAPAAPATVGQNTVNATTVQRTIHVPATTSTAREVRAVGTIADPGFESGAFASWQQCGSVNSTMSTEHPHAGTYSNKEGSASTTSGEINGDAGVCQLVTIPTGGKLSFWVYQISNESNTTYSYQEGDLLDSSGAVATNFYTTVSNAGAWQQKIVDLSAYAGQSLYIYFGVHGNGYASAYTTQWVDDVSWVSGATPTPSAAPTATPSPVATATPKPSATPSPTAAPTATPKATATPTATPKPTSTPTPSPAPSGAITPLPGPGAGYGSTTCGSSCGVERWHVKTMDDPQESQVNLTPKLYSVSQAIAWAVPSGLSASSDNIRFAPYELQAVRIRATFVGWKTETDNDYHLVIADPNNPSATMIVEPPSSACSAACGSGYASLFQAVRNKLVACLGTPPSSFGGAPSSTITADFTGIPLFDILHGQTGVAPNGIEIHPLMNVTFVSGPCTN